MFSWHFFFKYRFRQLFANCCSGFNKVELVLVIKSTRGQGGRMVCIDKIFRLHGRHPQIIEKSWDVTPVAYIYANFESTVVFWFGRIGNININKTPQIHQYLRGSVDSELKVFRFPSQSPSPSTGHILLSFFPECQILSKLSPTHLWKMPRDALVLLLSLLDPTL